MSLQVLPALLSRLGVQEVAVEEVVSGQPVTAMVVLVPGAVSLWQQSLLRLRKHSISMLAAAAV